MSVEDYLHELEFRGLSPLTVLRKRQFYAYFAQSLGRPVHTASMAEIQRWLVENGYKPGTMRLYRQFLKEYFDWRNQAFTLPPVKVKPKMLSPTDLVSPEEVLQMIQAVDHPRDRALIALLYETGGRAQEVLGIRVKDLEFGEVVSKVRLSGKTGDRIVPIIESVPYLQAWLNYLHLTDAEAKIWRGQRGASIGYNRLYKIITRTSERVLGRTIPPHRLRHSRASHLAAHPAFNQALLAQFGGWKPTSPILSTYIHLAGKDIEEAVLTMHGRKQVGEQPASPMEPQRCPRCQYENPADARFCSRCSLALDIAHAQQVLDQEQLFRQLRQVLARHPDLLKELLAELRQAKGSGGGDS